MSTAPTGPTGPAVPTGPTGPVAPVPPAAPLGAPVAAGPPPVAPVMSEPYLVGIGDIGVTASWVVTPRGTLPLRGSEWWLAERAGWRQQIPVWAIVLAVLFFPLGLLFLLVKEPRLDRWFEVTVRSAGVVHVAAVAVPSYEGAQVPGKVDYVRELAARTAQPG